MGHRKACRIKILNRKEKTTMTNYTADAKPEVLKRTKRTVEVECPRRGCTGTIKMRDTDESGSCSNCGTSILSFDWHDAEAVEEAGFNA
jgi:hypothetical protein